MCSDADIKFLLSCLINSTARKIDFQAVAHDSGYTHRRSASDRLARLKKRYNVHPQAVQGTCDAPVAKRQPCNPPTPAKRNVPPSLWYSGTVDCSTDHGPMATSTMGTTWPREEETMVFDKDGIFDYLLDFPVVAERTPVPAVACPSAISLRPNLLSPPAVVGPCPVSSPPAPPPALLLQNDSALVSSLEQLPLGVGMRQLWTSE
ncbi:hypothetical protein L873DRAFT_1849618 [Choiromyces venosus 120613-1]|uniref:Myb-like DNA-binding domain-containing protein n=1 Tax=Choiromyces venosus 120613-1 TaxID=1336337 RepID=A0A3N4ISK3_9PEZI|nr:hypothetical protein L873DRAFT_1849618 [Choiromyces venosus 120613-1]